MGLREMASTLPPGFRFHPNDHELVFHYLYNKVANDNERASSHGTLVEVDLHALEPWELPGESLCQIRTYVLYYLVPRSIGSCPVPLDACMHACVGCYIDLPPSGLWTGASICATGCMHVLSLRVMHRLSAMHTSETPSGN